MDNDKYDADGRLKNGIEETHFKDGSLSTIGEWQNGEKTGEWKYYLKNGKLKAIGRYIDGKMHGPWTWYRANGPLYYQDDKTT